MAHCDALEGKRRGNWRMEWVASTLHTISEHGVSTITTADAHTSAVSSRLNWRPRRFKWPRPFCRKTKSGFCACAMTFQTQSTNVWQKYIDSCGSYHEDEGSTFLRRAGTHLPDYKEDWISTKDDSWKKHVVHAHWSLYSDTREWTNQ
jgi:hypothetical protein